MLIPGTKVGPAGLSPLHRQTVRNKQLLSYLSAQLILDNPDNLGNETAYQGQIDQPAEKVE